MQIQNPMAYSMGSSINSNRESTLLSGDSAYRSIHIEEHIPNSDIIITSISSSYLVVVIALPASDATKTAFSDEFNQQPSPGVLTNGAPIVRPITSEDDMIRSVTVAGSHNQRSHVGFPEPLPQQLQYLVYVGPSIADIESRELHKDRRNISCESIDTIRRRLEKSNTQSSPLSSTASLHCEITFYEELVH